MSSDGKLVSKLTDALQSAGKAGGDSFKQMKPAMGRVSAVVRQALVLTYQRVASRYQMRLPGI